MPIKQQVKRLILASASPTRQRLLQQIGFPADVVAPADIDETALPKEKPKDLVLRLAVAKAQKIAAQYPEDVVLAADTIVFCRGIIMGKPEDAAEARQFLQKMSGRRHRLYTGLCVIYAGQVKSVFSESTVKIKRLTEQEIDLFVASNQWRGKAGGYSLRGAFAVFIESIKGSDSGIVGLPAAQTYNLLHQFLPFRPESV